MSSRRLRVACVIVPIRITRTTLLPVARVHPVVPPDASAMPAHANGDHLMPRRVLTTNLLILLAACGILAAGRATETTAERDARMAWCPEARFGMFVHWGLYSGLAGTWDGKPVATEGGMEWIENMVRAETDTYAKKAIPLFKPKPGFAREWARVAKE